MRSRSALTGASTHSTPSAPCSALLAMLAHRPSMNSIRENGCTLHGAPYMLCACALTGYLHELTDGIVAHRVISEWIDFYSNASRP